MNETTGLNDLHGPPTSQKHTIFAIRKVISKTKDSFSSILDDQEKNPKRPDEEEAHLLRSMETAMAAEGDTNPLDDTCDSDVSLSGWSRKEMALCCLRTRKYDPVRAVQIYREFCGWRRELNAHYGGISLMDNSSLRDQLMSGKIRFLHCVDRNDRPILHVRQSLHNPRKHSPFQVLQLFALIQETIMRDHIYGIKAQCNGFFIVQDGHGMTFKNFDLRFSKAQESMNKRAPFRVGPVVLVNQSTFGKWIYKIVRPFLPDKVKRRVVLIDSWPQMKKYVDDLHLLKCWGGRHSYFQEAWVDSVFAFHMTAGEEITRVREGDENAKLQWLGTENDLELSRSSSGCSSIQEGSERSEDEVVVNRAATSGLSNSPKGPALKRIYQFRAAETFPPGKKVMLDENEMTPTSKADVFVDQNCPAEIKPAKIGSELTEIQGPESRTPSQELSGTKKLKPTENTSTADADSYYTSLTNDMDGSPTPNHVLDVFGGTSPRSSSPAPAGENSLATAGCSTEATSPYKGSDLDPENTPSQNTPEKDDFESSRNVHPLTGPRDDLVHRIPPKYEIPEDCLSEP